MGIHIEKRGEPVKVGEFDIYKAKDVWTVGEGPDAFVLNSEHYDIPSGVCAYNGDRYLGYHSFMDFPDYVKKLSLLDMVETKEFKEIYQNFLRADAALSSLEK